MTPIVALHDVTRRFGSGSTQVVAVAGATMALLPGEMVGLAGPSGSGKTTLVHLVLGWERPDDGVVERAVGTASDWSQTAVVPQELGLVHELSVRENVALPARLGRAQPVDVEVLLGSLGLDELADRLPDELSMGERQRVAIARAVSCRPRLLVADEPTAHQDERRADLVMDALREVAARGGAVLVATHDERLLARVDRTLHILDGIVSA